MDETREGAPVRVGGVTLVPIERTLVSGTRGDAGFLVLAMKRPVALRIVGPDGERVVRLDDD